VRSRFSRLAFPAVVMGLFVSAACPCAEMAQARSAYAAAAVDAEPAESAPAARSLADGVYARQQARGGKKLYDRHCISCHDRRYFRQVMLSWQGQPLSELFGVMTVLMPQSNPGSLRRQEYLDVLAYILSLERYPAGDEALAAADLAAIEITPP
jgi:mono/diheme cytochrome c family protein